MKKILTFLLFAVLYIGNVLTASATELESTVQQAPVIQNISVLTKEIKAPGEVEVQIELDAERNQELSYVRLVFYGENNPDKMLYYWLSQESVIQTEDKYICRINLGDNIPADTYILNEIELYDSGDNTRTYVWNEEEEELIDWAEGYKTGSVKLVVIEGNKDTDHEAPVLHELSFGTVVSAGDELEVSVRATDLSGIRNASIVFYNHNIEQYLYLNECQTTDMENGTYKFTFKIHKYQYADTYELESITLTDGSAYANSTKYWLDGTYLKNEDGRKVSISTAKKYLKIEQKSAIRWTTTDTTKLYSAVNAADDNEVIAVITGDSNGSQWILDKRVLSAAKVRNLTLILPDLLTETEIVIDASKILTDLPDETYAGLEISEYENGYYDLKLQMTSRNVPFRMKFKTKELNSLADRTFSLAKVDQNGTEIVVREGMVIDKEGYLNFEFAESVESEDGWSYFRLRRNENAICENGHEWMEDTFLEKASIERDGYYTKVCESCGMVENVIIPRIEEVSLATTKFIYNGDVRKPTITVKDVNGKKLISGTDYKVTYASGRKNVGRYYVKVTFTGDYTGTSTKYFTIVPKAVTNLNAVRYQYGNQVRLIWTKSTGAAGYRVYVKKSSASKYTYLGSTKNLYYTKGSLTKNTAYRFKVIPYCKTNTGATQYYSTDAYKTTLINTVSKGNKLVQVSGVKAAKSGTKVKVSWKNVNYETGYQISRSASKTGTYIVATYKTTSGKSKIITATKNKTYYYKVRAYRVVDGKKVFGVWSEPVKYTRK